MTHVCIQGKQINLKFFIIISNHYGVRSEPTLSHGKIDSLNVHADTIIKVFAIKFSLDD